MSQFWDDVRAIADDNRLGLQYQVALARVSVANNGRIKLSEIAGQLVHQLAAVIACSSGEPEWKEAAERLHVVLRTRLEHLSGCGLH